MRRSSLAACAAIWSRYCRGLRPEEAGLLWALVGMAEDARIRGVVRARPEVIAVAAGTQEPACTELLRELNRKGLVRLEMCGDVYTVFVWMFGDQMEKSRESNRIRVRRWRGRKSA